MSDPVPIESMEISTYRIPTEQPESDGTCRWDSTTLVVVEVSAGGLRGLGYTYEDRAAATLIHDRFAAIVVGLDAFDTGRAWRHMQADVRNLGRSGIAACAISAVDNALWDLKAKLLGLPLVRLLGQVRDEIPVYGSGGFTSYDDARLASQLGGWSDAGFPAVKMKVGREPERDLERADVALDAVGQECELFVDANGAYTRKEAVWFADAFAQRGITWFEEPVPSDDLEGLRLLRDRAPGPLAITAGEYGYDALHFRRLLEAGAVDVLQADATRCCGISGLIGAAALCDAFMVPLSTHCAPSIHLHAACALAPIVHLEYFHDHVRIESMLFDGFSAARNGAMQPDLDRTGHGIELKRADADRYEI